MKKGEHLNLNFASMDIEGMNISSMKLTKYKSELV